MALSKARKKLKKRTIQTIKQREYNLLERQVKKQVQQVNQRLKSLERQHKIGTWSSGKLKTRIKSNKTKGLMYKGKRIRLKPKMTKTNLIQVQKATRQFLESATSTNKGIREARSKTIESLRDTLNFEREQEERLTDQEAEYLYSMLEDKSYRSLINEVGASLLWQEINYAQRHNISEDGFIERLNFYLEQDMDLDMQEQARNIYRKYVL